MSSFDVFDRIKDKIEFYIKLVGVGENVGVEEETHLIDPQPSALQSPRMIKSKIFSVFM